MKNQTAIEKIRYAVVGLGDLAQVAILPAFKNTRNSELVALVSGEAEKLTLLGKRYRVKHLYSYDEYDKALSVVDAVYIVLPNNLHREYAVRAANAGVHVLCEKPMAVTAQECEAMTNAAKRNSVKLMIAYRLHFEKGNLEAVRIAKSGKIGDLRAFTAEFAQQVPPGNVRLTDTQEEGGGPIYDMGVYCINASRYLFDDEPTEVFAFASSSKDPRFKKVEEMAAVVLRYPEDRLASFTCSFGAASISRYTLIGTKGVLTSDPAFDYTKPLKHSLSIGKKHSSKEFPVRDQFAAEILYFSDCILNNKEPEPSGLEGLADIRIVRAIYDSIRTGKTVKLSHMPSKKGPTPAQEIYRPAHRQPKTVGVQSPSGG
jgi:glucose-fructose oxidoreductase